MNNLRTSPLSSCKNLPPIFFMVHLLHRLYGVDAPVRIPSFLPARRHASAGIAMACVRLSVSVCHKSVFYQKE